MIRVFLYSNETINSVNRNTCCHHYKENLYRIQITR
jgi:hypothetical protein